MVDILLHLADLHLRRWSIERAFVFLHTLKDRFSSVCEFDCGDGFFKRRDHGTNGCDQRRLCSTAKGVLEQPGQLGFSERNVELGRLRTFGQG